MIRPRLAGKVCVVTGGGSGIGRATSVLFAALGASVVVADLDLQSAKDTAATIIDKGAQAIALPLDVTDAESCRELAQSVIATHSRIDVLFNNAGIAGIGPVHETSLDLWERVMAVNVTGVFLSSKYFLTHMIQRRAGSIINMSSCIADVGLPDRASYGASKGAVLSLTRCMQADYARFGIRVNAILPGTIHTPFVDRYLAESYEDPVGGLAAIRKRQLTGELGTADDVAYAAAYLASDESRFVLGSALSVDGGVRGAR